jgi:hypothetical protein
MNQVVLVEALEIIHPFLSKPETVVKFLEREFAVRIKIPQGMIKVKEKMFVFHEC